MTVSKWRTKTLQVFLTVEGNEEILPKLIVTTNKFKMFMEVFKVNSISQDYTLQITKKIQSRMNALKLN
jgi:UDP-N-acetylglucosamine 2-epimerase